jgi:hypothetical protein
MVIMFFWIVLEGFMSDKVTFHNDQDRMYRGVRISRNTKIKVGKEGAYFVKDSLRTSLQDAKEYIDAMIESCGIEFFNHRPNALIEDDF